MQRNDAIRIRIIQEKDQVKQYIADYTPFSVSLVSLSTKEDLEQFNQTIVQPIFSILDSNLFRFTLFQFKDGSGGLNVTFHHLIADAWTMSLFVSEVMELYYQLVQHQFLYDSSNPSYLEYLQTEQELLKVGDTVSLSHSTTPSSLNDTEIVYTSSDPSLVSVEGNTITAKKEGIVTITGTAQDEGKCQGSITIFVSDKTGTNYEAEQAKLENCNIESANNNYVGGFNNEGAKVTFTVSAPSDGDYLMRIYTSIVIAGNNNFNDYFNMYVNDAKLDSTKGTFAAKGEPGWNTDTGYYTIQVTLNEGENTIILEAVSTQTKTTLDKIVIY